MSDGYLRVFDSALCSKRMLTIGETIKRERERTGLTQTELGKAMGVKQPAVSDWENGNTVPDALQLVHLAACLKVPIQVLVDGVDGAYDKLCKDLIRQTSGVDSMHTTTHGGSPHARSDQARPTADDAEIRAIATKLTRISNQLAPLYGITAELEKIVHTLLRRQVSVARVARSAGAGHRRKIPG